MNEEYKKYAWLALIAIVIFGAYVIISRYVPESDFEGDTREVVQDFLEEASEFESTAGLVTTRLETREYIQGMIADFSQDGISRSALLEEIDIAHQDIRDAYEGYEGSVDIGDWENILNQFETVKTVLQGTGDPIPALNRLVTLLGIN